MGNGAVFAAVALALVVTYRSSGVVNFAVAAIGLYAAYTYAFLRQGSLLVPIPGVDATVGFGRGLPVAASMAVALLVAAVLGGLLHLAVFRPLRAAPATTTMVASIGAMVLIQAVLAARVGNEPVRVDPILPRGRFVVGGVSIPQDRIAFAVAVCLIAGTVVAGFRYTIFGLAARASAESEKGALVTGLSPDRIALASAMISAVVAGLGGILIAPIVPLSAVSYTLFIVPALAAAMVGGFSLIPPAILAGLGIGMVQSELTFLQAQHSWALQRGPAELVPLVVILGYLLVRGRPLPTRGALAQRTLGRAPRPRSPLPAAAVGVVAALVLLVFTNGGTRASVITSLIYALIALSLVVVMGYAGQVSLAQLTLAGGGAYGVSLATTSWHVPFPVAPLLAAAMAAVVGVVVGLPALRVRGLPVAAVTLALAVVLEAVWFQNPTLARDPQGQPPVAEPTLLGLDLGAGTGRAYPTVAFGIVCVVALLVVALGVARLRTSRLGAAMLAVRANERSAAASGIDVARTKMVAFGIGAFIAGLGGALLAYQYSMASPASFDPLTGLALFATVYLAGVSSITGGLLAGVMAAGGVLYVALDQVISLGEWYYTLSAIGVLVTVVRNPEGLAGGLHDGWHRALAALPVVRRRAGDADAPRRAATAGLDGPARPPAAAPPPAPAPAERTMVMAIDGITVRYGGVAAVRGVSLAVRTGEIVGLIGSNGAGKTSLIDAVTGFSRSVGSVRLGGRPLDRQPPFRRARLGLGRTFQHQELYPDLTVEENVLVGTEADRRGHDPARVTAADGTSAVGRVLALLDLGDVRHRPVAELSQGRRQLVAVARALAGAPDLLLLDEPAAGLDSGESDWLADRLRVVRAAGVAMLLVDHDMSFVMSLCDRVCVLDLGELIAVGTPAEIQRDPRVAAAYLGAPDHGGGDLPPAVGHPSASGGSPAGDEPRDAGRPTADDEPAPVGFTAGGSVPGAREAETP
ncbi:ABC transporter [Pseudofrankia sp. BMG5.36]|nr:ABC transporter [Pseudofrankia sp. BMG5.36]